MKSLKLTLLLMSSFLLAHAQREKTDLEKDKLKGSVKSVVSTGYKVDNSTGKVRKGRTIHSSTSKYNDKGYVTLFISTSGKDTVEGEYVDYSPKKTTYIYDNKNNLIGSNDYDPDGNLNDSSSYTVDNKGNRIDWYTYKADGTVEQNFTTEYDAQGNLIESNEYYKGKLKERHTYKYDAKGHQSEDDCFGGDSRMKWKETFNYDLKGNLVEVTDFKRNGSFDARFEYGYDIKGNQIEEKEYASESSLKHKRILTKYDTAGNVTEVNQFNETGHFASQCKMDKKGNHLVDITYFPDGTLQEKIPQSFKYDDYGNEIEQVRYFADGRVASRKEFKYDYDRNGNWVKKTTFENGQPKRLAEREISYY